MTGNAQQQPLVEDFAIVEEHAEMAGHFFEVLEALAPQLLDLPTVRLWATYDAEADVLYLNFKKPSHADDSKLTDDDILIRYEQGEIVGVTIINASRRLSGRRELRPGQQ